MRFGPRNILIPGFAMVTIALLLFARTPVDGNYLTDLLPPFLLIGVGIGTSFPAIMTLAMSGATPEDAGLASGLVNTSMQVGGAIGLAVLATLSSQRTEDLPRRGPVGRRGADLRLPPRLPGRRRARLRLGADRDLRAEARADARDGRPRPRRRTGRGRGRAAEAADDPDAGQRRPSRRAAVCAVRSWPSGCSDRFLA